MTWDHYLGRVTMWLWGLDRTTALCGLVSTAFCLILIGICMCRMTASNKGVLARVRLSYSVLGTSAAAAILLPITRGELGVWGAVIALEIGAIGAMLAGSHRWRGNRPPDDVLTKPGDIEPFRG